MTDPVTFASVLKTVGGVLSSPRLAVGGFLAFLFLAVVFQLAYFTALTLFFGAVLFYDFFGKPWWDRRVKDEQERTKKAARRIALEEAFEQQPTVNQTYLRALKDAGLRTFRTGLAASAKPGDPPSSGVDFATLAGLPFIQQTSSVMGTANWAITKEGWEFLGDLEGSPQHPQTVRRP
jgi:hypothetical protein